MQKEKLALEGGEEFGKIVEVWESFGGDLWVLTEVHEGGDTGFGYARLSSSPQFAEWGHIHRAELIRNSKVWQVEEKDWSNIDTYDGVNLVEV